MRFAVASVSSTHACWRFCISCIAAANDWRCSRIFCSVAAQASRTAFDLWSPFSDEISSFFASPGAYLWIAGDGALEAKLKAMAAALGVADRVRFLGWRNDAGALYRTADVCVFPSRFEPLGNVVIQAWAHGLPVVAADSQGPGALIRHGEDGLLVPIDEAEPLADGVKVILADPMLKIRLIQNGHARVENEFSKAAVIDEWRSLFSRLGAA